MYPNELGDEESISFSPKSKVQFDKAELPKIP
jgi:hypothetical protein